VTEIVSSGDDERTAHLRTRLMDALEQLLAEHPYGDVTVTDIVSRAGTSKRAFYEVYPHKAACLLDQGVRFHAVAQAELERQVLDAKDRLDGVRVAVRGFLGHARRSPWLAQAHLVEVYSMGPEAIALREKVKRQYAGVVRRLASLDDGTETVDLDDETALQVAGTLDDTAIRVAFGDLDDDAYERLLVSTERLVRAFFVGYWVEDRWGPIELGRLPGDLTG
jgi:AcrR family transcriptional regulator